MAAYSSEPWGDLFVAAAGASAALAGLLFVAVSINLERILSFPTLPARAGTAIIVLVNALVISIVCLMPDQSRTALGVELTVLALVGWALPVRAQLGAAARADDHRRGHVALTQMATLPFVIGGVSVLACAGGGLYWIAAGVALTFVCSTATAWVLLVEILR